MPRVRSAAMRDRAAAQRRRGVVRALLAAALRRPRRPGGAAGSGRRVRRSSCIPRSRVPCFLLSCAAVLKSVPSYGR